MTKTYITPTIEYQYDTATFPSSSPVAFAAIGCDVDLSVDADNGSATINVATLPGAIDDGVRLYIFADSTLIFNGYCTAVAWNADGTYTISCQDALAKLRNRWGGADRTYNATLPDTDTSTAQNIVEASGIDASLTSITGEGRTIGTVQDVVIHGGEIDPLTGSPTSADVMLDVLRLLDRSVVPNFVTFTRGDGAVYRRAREIGSSVASFADGAGGAAWDFQRSRQPGTIVNKWLVKGLTIADVPTEASASAANSHLVAPWEYNSGEFTSYLVDDVVWAQALADWKLSDTNGRLNQVSWTTAINNAAGVLGATSTVTSARCGLSSKAVYVAALKHHIDGQTATTSYQAEFRD